MPDKRSVLTFISACPVLESQTHIIGMKLEYWDFGILNKGSIGIATQLSDGINKTV